MAHVPNPGRIVAFATSHDLQAPLQLSAHHLARCFAEDGWRVLFVPAPLSPVHVISAGRNGEHRRRVRAWSRSCGVSREGGVEQVVPFTVLPLAGAWGYRRRWSTAAWPAWTVPRLAGQLRRLAALRPALAVVDTPVHAPTIERLRPERLVYRVTDYTPGFAAAGPRWLAAEAALARRADLVTYASPGLAGYVSDIAPQTPSTYLGQAVDLDHFGPRGTPEPPDLAPIPRPRAVYVGALREWFDWGLLADVARRRPAVSFVVIGPDGRQQRRALAPNVHLLGPRAQERVPAYLEHCDVGIIPFDVGGSAALIERVNPLKLYEYLAARLPVVATPWAALRALESPALLAAGAASFAGALDRSLEERDDLATAARRFAAEVTWDRRYRQLLEALEGVPADSVDR